MITPRQLYQGIAGQLLNPAFLAQLKLDKDYIRGQIESPLFIGEVSRIAKEKDYSCQAVYALCHDTLHQLWNQRGPEEPLYYIYQYALSYSFPDSVEISLKEEWEAGALYYLHILRVICHFQRLSKDQSFMSRYPLHFLTEEEEQRYGVSEEYSLFKRAFQEEFIYEMMKLNQEVMGHNTLDHICGVHHLALLIGRQLYTAGIPVDLGRVSGAAAGHDLGKFGCKSSEGNRVAYLHYYYTDLWFKGHEITYIGHIALNHSTWDLELENLSIESLILIYSDFRVKNIAVSEGKYEMQFFSLKDSFEVILNKLDNVDTQKERRYTRVYDKLRDFEAFMLHLGLQLEHDAKGELQPHRHQEYYALMKGDEVTEHLKYLAIHHNIHLMHQFRNETSLNEILEVVRSEKDPRNLREYLDVLQEYSTYLTQKQKLITLRFLYEKLTHHEEDIRRQCAELMGTLIALFDEDYRKEIPQGVTLPPAEVSSSSLLRKYLKNFIYPHYSIIPLHRQWMGYSIKILITSIFQTCSPQQVSAFKEVILAYYSPKTFDETDSNIYLLDVIRQIPLEDDQKAQSTILSYIERCYLSQNEDLKVAALDAINGLIPLLQQRDRLLTSLEELLNEKPKNGSAAENYLRLKIAKKLQWKESAIEAYHWLCLKDLNQISNIFLSNLKTATNWVTKKVQVKMLLEYFLEYNNMNGLYIAIHYCNLLKVSAVESVRNGAGSALVALFPKLPLEQRNDLAIELLRALEIEGYQFTKYIPNYLGQILLYLPPFELDEIIEDLNEKLKQSNNQIKALLLRTLGIMIANYPKYADSFSEPTEIYEKRRSKLLGILLNGLVHDDLQIRQISFSVIGKGIFGSQQLNLAEKYVLFQATAKKILTLLADSEETQLLFLTNSSGLNHIYRFIADYSFHYGRIQIDVPERVALFPGTFDPFTLGHKEISRAIRDLGFEVYLAVDEFSWSKRTQPNLIRKNIINMSIADEMNIYLYPENFPTNIANPADLKTLEDNLGNEKVFIVVGSDVVLNASAYQVPPRPHSIHRFSHIIFERRDGEAQSQDDLLKQALKQIQGEVITLNLPPQLEEISSTQIRNYIDENRDISRLIDPMAQKYIYENNLYRREPQYKSVVQTISIDIEVVADPPRELVETLIECFHRGVRGALDTLTMILKKPEARLVILRDIADGNRPIAYTPINWVPSEEIYQEFKNSQISEIIRDQYKGRIVAINGLFINETENTTLHYQRLLTETLAYCLKNDYGYGIYHHTMESRVDKALVDLIKRYGFVTLDTRKPILAVDMTYPCTLNLDLETIIKEPFHSNEAVKAVIAKTRIRLQEALNRLYPGHLVLPFDRGIIDETLVRKICKENGVSTTPSQPRKLGDLMCVPFGNILNRAIVPNTVTKSLHVEKLFQPDMKGFTIGPYPYYLDLANQIKMIGSFNRPVILVDDLLNKGYRIKGIDPLLKAQQVEVRKIIVGILSGKGKELMEIQNREVDSAYFIPKLRLWFNENLLYPFIGGDTLWRGVYPEKNLLSSINLILPYTSPHFITGVTNQSVYDLSEVSILNAIDILEVLEHEYQRVNERRLTLSLLSDVFLFPRCPDPGENMFYDLSLNPSSYLKNDLELLRRLEHSIITGDIRRS